MVLTSVSPPGLGWWLRPEEPLAVCLRETRLCPQYTGWQSYGLRGKLYRTGRKIRIRIRNPLRALSWMASAASGPGSDRAPVDPHTCTHAHAHTCTRTRAHTHLQDHPIMQSRMAINSLNERPPKSSPREPGPFGYDVRSRGPSSFNRIN